MSLTLLARGLRAGSLWPPPCFCRPQARRGLGTGASTGQALSSGAARELAMTSQRADAGEMGLAAKGPTGSRQ